MTPEETNLRAFIKASLADCLHDQHVLIFLRRNLGIAKEDLLNFVNNDVELPDGKYQKLSDFFMEHVKPCQKH